MTALSSFANDIMQRTYAQEGETWKDVAARVVMHVTSVVDLPAYMKRQMVDRICERKWMPAGRYLYAAGRDYHQVQNCLALMVEDSREGWGELLHHAGLALMTGAGIGVEYSKVREKGISLSRIGGVSSGPLPLINMVNEIGRGVQQGGSRRSAIWAGLNWKHPDIYGFIKLKNWSEDVSRLKAQDFNYPAPLDQTNISVGLDDDFFVQVTDQNSHARHVFDKTIASMLKTGDPGFTINLGEQSGDIGRNACCEFVTSQDSDPCNLGSVNLARIPSITEFRELVNLGTAFLLAGSVYSHVPYHKVETVRDMTRQIGLGLMGIHEWLITRGLRYAKSLDLEAYLNTYETESRKAADYWADKWKLARPTRCRSIAPNGTVSIVAETTGGIEPVFCVAYKRRYLRGMEWHHQYVVDPTAKRLISQGVDPTTIEDSYSLAADLDRRLEFQGWVQQFVDHAISSTINIPAWGTEQNNETTVKQFSETLLRHLPSLRGVTVYPDGGRVGQPLTPVAYEEAVQKQGVEHCENMCSLRGSSCGD